MTHQVTNGWPLLTPAVRDLIDAVAEAPPELRADIKRRLREAAASVGGDPVMAAAARFVEAVEVDADLDTPQHGRGA